jgi:hypothetical protein
MDGHDGSAGAVEDDGLAFAGGLFGPVPRRVTVSTSWVKTAAGPRSWMRGLLLVHETTRQPSSSQLFHSDS